ncbi:hypothetical protein [Actomonas aquatica]|uniref:FeoB-associated Cys-rich membrane protein n=1 Tax=Actomonas aquatica TaxID=2866162 RepID=A0ABZ1C3N1_9BACT|nr:hypothetical protein [Opitutus sp. WL0086]WRQ86106.1 hypothetical protein K1X11_014925 [Opitutus sp. WL0086]
MFDLPWQSLVAPLIVLLAIGYLAFSYLSKRRQGGVGCASGGSCACPQPKLKLPPHLQPRR